ncbi:hypothetical protein ACM66B_001331 [Microbotryomycetes sp. NB124-2]
MATTPGQPLPTPHAPGFLPETPSGESTTKYSEGVLEQAGRDLDLDKSLSPEEHKSTLSGALLGAGVGLVLGGPVGAVVGGSLGGLGSLENLGLKAKLRNDDTTTTSTSSELASRTQEPILTGQQHDNVTEHDKVDLGVTPAQRELERARGPGATNDLAAAALAGAAGAHVADHELEEPSSSSPATADAPMTATTQQPTQTQAGFTDTDHLTKSTAALGLNNDQKHEAEEDTGLSTNQKLALGAGAGLAAGGIGGAALASHSDQQTADPAPFATHSGPPQLAQPVGATSSANPLPQEPMQPQPAMTRAQPEPQRLHDYTQPAAFATSSAQPAHDAAATSTAPSSQQAQSSTARADIQPVDAQRTNESDEQRDNHRKEAETAAGAALGAAGVVGGVEAVKAAGSSRDDVDFSGSKNVDPAAALAAQLAGKDHVSPAAFEHNPQNDTSPQLPSLDRRATEDDRGLADDEVVEALATKGFDAQRVILPENTNSSSLSSASRPGETLKIDPKELHNTTAVGVVPGFDNQSGTGTHSTAFDDFAHLSQQPSSSSETAIGSVGEDDLTHQDGHRARDAAILGLGGAAAGTGLAAAYAAEHGHPAAGTMGAPMLTGSETAPGAAAPVAPTLDEQRTSADSSHTTPAAAAAMGGGALAGAGAYGLASHAGQSSGDGGQSFSQGDQFGGGQVLPQQQQQQPAPATPLQDRSYLTQSASGASAPSSIRAVQGTPPNQTSVERQEEGFSAATTAPVVGQTRYDGHVDDDRTSLDRDVRDDVNDDENLAAGSLFPVEKSPHLKIQSRKDPDGHRKLHKKSLGDPLMTSGSAASGEGDSSDSGSRKSGGHHHGAGAALVGAGAGAGAAGALHRQRGVQDETTAATATAGQTGNHEGQRMWRNSVSHVVDDETAHRGGHRPELVGHEDASSATTDHRRSSIIDRVSGVPDPTSPTPHLERGGKVLVDESGHKKLHRRHHRDSSNGGGSFDDNDKSSSGGGGFFSRLRRGSKSSHKSDHSASGGVTAATGGAVPRSPRIGGNDGDNVAGRHSTEIQKSPRLEPEEARISSEIPPVPGVTVPFEEAELQQGRR